MVAAFGVAMLWLDRWGQTDRAQKADAIVVLGARVYHGAIAGPSLSARTHRAVELYQRGLAAHIITTGGVGHHPPAESLVAKKLAVRLGVPEAAILTEETSTSTWENAENVATICRERGWKRVIVVSDPFHLWRARRNFQALGLTAYVSPSVNRRFSSRFHHTAREVPLVLRDALIGRL